MKKLTVLACLGVWLFSAAAFAGPQQEKMKTCNKEAREKALKGDQRKAFMKSCLSNGKKAAHKKAAAEVEKQP